MKALVYPYIPLDWGISPRIRYLFQGRLKAAVGIEKPNWVTGVQGIGIYKHGSYGVGRPLYDGVPTDLSNFRVGRRKLNRGKCRIPADTLLVLYSQFLKPQSINEVARVQFRRQGNPFDSTLE